MRKIIVVLALITSTLFFAQEEHSKLQWETNFELAKKTAKETKKPILLLFTGSDWSPPCKKLKKEFFNTEKFKTYSNKFILVYVDFPKNKTLVTAETAIQNTKLNSIYKVRSLPTILIVNEQGERLDEKVGFNSAGDTKQHYKFLDRNL